MGVVTAVVGTALTVGMGVASAIKASKEEQEYADKLKIQEGIMTDLINNRQEVINPMAGLTNEAEKVGVATQAARFQAEEADMALANTLDVIMQTGGGAAGATALAQMALKSKQGISADIQKQELQNAKNIANTQMAIDQQIGEGNKYAWEMNEKRELQMLDRTQNLADKYEAQMFNAEAQKWEAYGTIASGVTTGFGNVASAMGTNQSMDDFNAALEAFTAGQQNSAGTVTSNTGIGSDRRLKKNIKHIGNSKSGIKIYTFEYIDKEGIYKGVMSDEIPSNAVIKGVDGYDLVDYSKIDVEFEKIK